jgi:magnesium transporter
MPENNNEQTEQQDLLERFSEAFATQDLDRAVVMLTGMYPAEIAHLLESLPPEKRDFVWQLVDPEQQGDVLLEVNDDIRGQLIQEMAPAELIAVSESLADIDDLADFVQELEDHDIQLVLQSMDEQDRQRLEAVLSYPEDTAGGIMNTDTLTVRPENSIDTVLRYLRKKGELPRMTDSLIVVDRNNRYLGVVPLTTLLTREPQLKIGDLVDNAFEGIPAEMKDSDVATLFAHRDFVSAPVVDNDGVLLGRITVDDVVDVIRDDADHSLMRMAGLNEEDDMFAPVIRSSRRRAFWLGINLLTALAASWVIGLFDTTIQKLVALAVLMPVVASMGGIAGSQTLTLVIRGMALGQITGTNARRLLRKELAVGILNGLVWAIIVAGVAIGWFGDVQLGVIIGAAIIVNLITAAFAGALIPLMLRKLGTDPALGGGVVLTTVTDIIGFFAFLGLATLFLT